MIIEYRIFIFIVDKSFKLTAFMIAAYSPHGKRGLLCAFTKHYVILHLLVEFALYMFCNLSAKVIKILKSYAAFYRKRVAILEKMDCNPLYLIIYKS